MRTRILLVIACVLAGLAAGNGPGAHGAYDKKVNVSRGNVSYLQELVTWSRKKSDELRRLPSISALPLNNSKDFNRRIGVNGGEWLEQDPLEDGMVLGSGGAGPCIGLILMIPKPGGTHRFVVYHFTATEDPQATLAQLGRIPKGTRAAIFGGDNGDESNFTLRGVMRFLRGKSSAIHIDGYSDSEGLWIDNKGRYYRFSTDRASRNEKD